MIEQKKIDILCGLIASPQQRVVHQLPDTYCPKGAFFPRSSHTTVPFNGIGRAASGLIKGGYLSVDKARSDQSQIEYRCSAKGRRLVVEDHSERLEAHRRVMKTARRDLKRTRSFLPKLDTSRSNMEVGNG